MRRLLLPGAAFIVYFWLAAAGNDWLDAGELSAAAYTLGVSHPPAQPVHALLGKAMTFLPFGEIAFRLSLLSALATALAVAGVLELCRRFLPDGAATWVAGVAAAVLVGSAPIVVEQATRPEVYAPALALVVWGTAFAVGFVRKGAARDVLLAAACFALCAGLQPLIAAAAAAIPALAIAFAARRRLLRLAPAVLGLGVLALLVYAYLPLRANAVHRPLLLWEDPRDLTMFLRAVRGDAYAGNFATAGLGERVIGHAWLLGEGAGLPLLLAGGAGLVFAAITRLRAAGTLLATAALIVTAAASQKVFFADNPDVHGYLTPALPLLAAGLAALVVGISRALHAQLAGLPPGRVAALLVIPVLALALAGPSVHARDGGARLGDDPDRYVDETLGRVPVGPAILVTTSDHALFTAQYERLVGGDRPDVAVSNTGLMTSSWFLTHLNRLLPELFVPFHDDGGRKDSLGLRFVRDNLSAGRPVYAELPPAAPLVGEAHGWIFRVQTTPARAEPAHAPLAFHGEIGRRVARFTGMTRARYEARAGRWLEAARAAGVLDFFGPDGLATLAAAPAAPALFLELASPTEVFLFADWQAEVVARDAAFAAGMGPGPTPVVGRPFEVWLLHAWHLLLVGDAAGAEHILAQLGVEARMATANLLARRDRGLEAEAQLGKALEVAPGSLPVLLFYSSLAGNRGDNELTERLLDTATRLHPRSAEAWRNVGILRARQQRMPEALAAWDRSLAINPDQPEVRALVTRAANPSGP